VNCEGRKPAFARWTKTSRKDTYRPDELEAWAGRRSIHPLLGVDEAGRGPLAGPVTAAVVSLPTSHTLVGLTDSKLLSESKRVGLFDVIQSAALAYGIAQVSAEEIDRIGILPATFSAMRMALEQATGAGFRPALVLVDGTMEIPSMRLAQRAVVRGDRRSQNIAAASILAKVTRDRWMVEAHERWPHYGFEQHKGYGTKAHLAAIIEHGPCPIHRRSFRGVKPR
jgi:ribonuclease HII